MASKADELFVDISEVAKKDTQRKQPPLNGNGQNGHPHTNGSTNGQPNGSAEQKFYTPPAEEKKTEPAPAAEQAQAEQKKSVDEEKLIEAAGKTGASLTAGIMEMVFGLANTGVYLTAFTTAQKEKLLEIEDKPEEQLDEQERSLNYRFLKRTQKYENTRDKKIPLNQRELDILAQAFADHRRITGEDMNPKLILWMSILRVCVSRGMEICF